MTDSFGWWVDVGSATLHDNKAWVHALPFGTYQHPLYGEMAFDTPRLTRFANSVKNKTRGIDPDIDYDHKEDPAKGHQAAGWVKDAEVRTDGLHLQVEFTDDAATEIKSGKYKYFSSEFADTWTDPQGNKHQDVIFGGGLTNRPFMKNLMPVNLSELFSPNKPPEVDEVDGKKLREALGLAENTTDDGVFSKLAELGQSLLKVPELTARITELETENAKLKAPEDVVDPELKKLIEGSPAFAKLHEANQKQAEQLKALQDGIRLAETDKLLTELQAGKSFALSTSARDAAKEIMLKSSPEIAKALHELLSKVVAGEAVVDLTERGHGNRRDAGDSVSRFTERVRQLMEADKNLNYADAVTAVASENPALYNEYRDDTYSFRS